MGGILFGSAKTKLEEYFSYCVVVMAYTGLLYTAILFGIVIEYLPQEWLLVANVYVGLPMILSGIIVTLMQLITTYRLIQEARRTGKGWRWVALYVLVDLWNLFATFHNIRVWIQSVQMLREVGGIKAVYNIADDSSGKTKIVLYLLLSALITLFIIVGLFQIGKVKGIQRLERI